MDLGRYCFSCTLTDSALLPPYKGSTFRGAFGMALRQTVCALRKHDCVTCLLAGTCIYARVFERKSADSRTPHLAAPPHPYIIRPPLTEERAFQAGSEFDFELLLFGEFNAALPYFIYAFEKMGELGIGKGKARFKLNQVSCAGQLIYRGGEPTLRQVSKLDRLEVAPPGKEPAVDLRFRMLTPLRVKHRGQLVRRLDFSTLTRITLRRLSGLLAAYGEGEPALDYPGLVRQAEQVEIVEDHSRWHDWQRYSNRQRESMQFGGLRGEIIYRQVPGIHLSLLRLAEQVHLGKQSSFGLGLVEVAAL